MSQHPSLRSSEKDKQHRSVLKRYERIRILKEKEKWKDGDSVFGLQKVKVLRFKIKKEKVAKETAEGAEVAAAPGLAATPQGTTPTTGQSKAASQAKTASAKEAAKSQSTEGKKEAKK